MQPSEPVVKVYPNVVQSFAITGILLLCMIVCMPVYFLLIKMIGRGASFLIYYVLAVGISFSVVDIIKKKKTGYNSFNFIIENVRVIPLVIMGIIFLYGGIISPITALISMSESADPGFVNYAKLPGIFTLFQWVIAAPILEELIFTGIILDGLLKKYAPSKSIFITCFLFGMAHLNLIQFVTAFIMGIFTGWVYYRSRCLTLTILIHAVANLTCVFMRYFIILDSRDYVFFKMVGGITNLILVVAIVVAILVFCIYLLKREFNKMKPEMV